MDMTLAISGIGHSRSSTSWEKWWRVSTNHEKQAAQIHTSASRFPSVTQKHFFHMLFRWRASVNAFLRGRSIACLLLLPLFVDGIPGRRQLSFSSQKPVRTRLCYWLKITLKLQPLNLSQQRTDKKVCLFLLASVWTNSHGTFAQKSFPPDRWIDLTVGASWCGEKRIEDHRKLIKDSYCNIWERMGFSLFLWTRCLGCHQYVPYNINIVF